MAYTYTYGNADGTLILKDNGAGHVVALEPTGAFAAEYAQAQAGDFGPVAPYVPPPEPPPDLPAALTAYRYARECEGVVVEGLRYHTDRESRATWVALFLAATADPDFVLPAYKAMDGWALDLGAGQISTIYLTGQVHIAACFAVEEGLAAALPSMSTVAEVQAAFDAAYAAAGGSNG
jgi:hypothetical protein